MLYLAIPAHNEAATIGVLLWRLRTVLAEFPREYEAVVYDDASSDSTSEILESYARVMPLTVLRGERRVGYAGAVDALVRHVARDTRYPRRDAMLLLQGDFTDSPAMVPEFVKRFEGGTDVVVGERGSAVRRKAPTPVRRLMRAEPWLLRFLVRADGIRDLTSSYRLVRISVLRDLLRAVGDGPICAGDARTANADMLMRLVPLARRVETLPVEPTWEVRLRETRVVAVSDGMNLLRWAWKSRGLRAVPSSAPEPANEQTPRHTRGSRAEREGRPELRLESRSDWTADGASASSESPRHGGRDGARNGRKARPARAEGRGEGRNQEVKSKVVEREAVAPSTDVDSPAREKPAKRKRSRRGGRDRETSRTSAIEIQGEPDALEVGSQKPIDEAAGAASPSFAEVADDVAIRTPDVTLSAGLRDAVADVEAELDGEGRRPRRKRRRRGSRSGRGSGGDGLAAGEDLADGAAAEGAESHSAFGDGGESMSSGDDPGHSRTLSHRSFRESDDSGTDLADGSAASESDGEDSAPPGGADGSPESAEARTRRRGRRGRRGGSRRSRAQRGEADGGGSNESLSGDASPGPARESSSAPEAE